LIAYHRVSTQRQGRSGPRIEAQRKALVAFAQAEAFEIAGEFTEVETGKGADALARRPQLKAALKAAKAAKCSVAVAKLDRLSRDVTSTPPSPSRSGACSQRTIAGLAAALYELGRVFVELFHHLPPRHVNPGALLHHHGTNQRKGIVVA
jgi:hypothetical protein